MSDPRQPDERWIMPAADWNRLREAARELDLVHGGYFRLRANSIAVFAGPDNHPAGWDLPYRDGSPDLPRQYVGEFQAEAEDGEIVIRLVVANWAAVQAVKTAYDQGYYRGRFTEFIRDQARALRGRPADRAWLRDQFELLRRHAGGNLLGG